MTNTTNTENRVMTITEAARQIGRSRDFVRSLIADQQINARQHRGRWYVNAASLNDWTNSGSPQPAPAPTVYVMPRNIIARPRACHVG